MTKSAAPRRQTQKPSGKSQSARRKKKPVVPPSSPVPLTRGQKLLHEVISVGLYVTSLFLVASVGWYALKSHYPTYFKGNLVGPVGWQLGKSLFITFGSCSLLIAFWLLIHALRWWHAVEKPFAEKPQRWHLLAGSAAVLMAACVAAYSLWGDKGGGKLGAMVARPLIELFGSVGALIGSIALLAIILPLALATTLSALAGTIAGLIRKVAKGAFIELPQAIAHWLTIFYSRYLQPSFNSWGDWLSEKYTHVEPVPLLPAPPQEVKPKRTPPKKVEKIEEKKEAPKKEEVVESKATFLSFTSAKKSKESSEKAAREKIEADKIQLSELLDRLQASASGYTIPSVDLLQKNVEKKGAGESDAELDHLSELIEQKLKNFNIEGRVTEKRRGPVITLFEFEPAPGVKVGRIAALQDDLAMSLRATAVRIIAPLPNKGTVGIEVPNKHRELVRLRDVLESRDFLEAESKLSVPIGKDTDGLPVIIDIASMPHLLIAGATGTGKSVCINTLLVSLLYRATPAELGLILIDPKILELSVYEGIPHLRVPVVTVPKQAKAVLDWAVKEMDRRYRLMQRYGVRNIDSYNNLVAGITEDEPPQEEEVIELREEDILEEKEPEQGKLFAEKLQPLPKIVIVIDELADLMLQVGRDIEELITRLAQKARAAGIHLIVATQRPSVDVITGLIKANFPARISFRVTSRIDSRTILDSMGSERLLGKGDMLFMQPGAQPLKRVHGAFVADAEVNKVVASIKSQTEPCYDEQILAVCEKALQEEGGGGGDGVEDGEGYDPFYDKAVELVISKGQASTSMIQRAFRIGYNRAARIIEIMEREGVVGPMDGVKPREVLVPTRDNSEDIN